MKLSDRATIAVLTASTLTCMAVSALGVCLSKPGSGWQLFGAFTAGGNFAVLAWCALLWHSDLRYRRRQRERNEKAHALLARSSSRYDGPRIACAADIDHNSDVDGDGS